MARAKDIAKEQGNYSPAKTCYSCAGNRDNLIGYDRIKHNHFPCALNKQHKQNSAVCPRYLEGYTGDDAQKCVKLDGTTNIQEYLYPAPMCKNCENVCPEDGRCYAFAKAFKPSPTYHCKHHNKYGACKRTIDYVTHRD